MCLQSMTVVICLLGIVYITPTGAQECDVIISGFDDKVAPPRNCAKGVLYWNYPHDKVDIEFRRLSMLPGSTSPIKVCLRLVTGGHIDVTRTARKGRIVDLTPLEGDTLSCFNQGKRRVTVTLDAGPDVVYYMHLIEYTAEEKARKPNQPRLRFDIEKLRNPGVAYTFQATIDGKFASLRGLRDEDIDINTMIITCNTAVTDAASEIFQKERRKALDHQRYSRSL